MLDESLLQLPARLPIQDKAPLKKESSYSDIKIKVNLKKARKVLEWKLTGNFAQSPNAYISSQLDSFIGWKNYYKNGKTFRFKCCQGKNGCQAELKITQLKDDPEDFLDLEIKVESSGEHTNHNNEDLRKNLLIKEDNGVNRFYNIY